MTEVNDKQLELLKKEMSKSKDNSSNIDLDAVDSIVNKLKQKDKSKGITGPVSESHLKELRDIISEGKLTKLNIDTEAKLMEGSESVIDKKIVKLYKPFQGFINTIVKYMLKQSIGKKISFYLYSANIKRTLVQHLVLAVLFSMLVTVFLSFLLFIILTVINPLFLIVLPFIALAIFLFSIFIFSYILPMQKAKQRGAQIDTELPYALRHLSTELQAGIGLYKTLQSIAKNDYGLLADELSRTIIEIENGTDTKTALRHTALRSQSKNFNIALFHIIRTLNTGGNLAQSIDGVAETVSFDLLESAKQFGEKMNFFGIIFIFVAIVLPVFLAVLSAIANAPIGQGGELFLPGVLSAELLGVVYLVVLPVILGFISFYIKVIEPKT
jgi:archaeal flagellar protein FlaJ